MEATEWSVERVSASSFLLLTASLESSASFIYPPTSPCILPLPVLENLIHAFFWVPVRLLPPMWPTSYLLPQLRQLDWVTQTLRSGVERGAAEMAVTGPSQWLAYSKQCLKTEEICNFYVTPLTVLTDCNDEQRCSTMLNG